MANVTNLSVGTGSPTPIVATVWGNTVVIQEAAQVGATTNLNIYHVAPNVNPPAPTAAYKQIQAGGFYQFTRGTTQANSWRTGDIVGYVQTVTGTTTICVDEGGA